MSRGKSAKDIRVIIVTEQFLWKMHRPIKKMFDLKNEGQSDEHNICTGAIRCQISVSMRHDTFLCLFSPFSRYQHFRFFYFENLGQIRGVQHLPVMPFFTLAMTVLKI